MKNQNIGKKTLKEKKSNRVILQLQIFVQTIFKKTDVTLYDWLNEKNKIIKISYVSQSDVLVNSLM